MHDCSATLSQSTMLNVLSDRLDQQLSLVKQHKSRFQRLWRRASLIKNGERQEPQDEHSVNLRYCLLFASNLNFQNVFRHPESNIYSPRRNVPYKWIPSSFIVRQQHMQLAFYNKHIIWLSEQPNTSTPLGINLYVPIGYFGITFYKCLDSQFVCMPELIEPGLQNLSMDVINLNYTFQAITPGTIEGDLCIFPCFCPEPWQVMNISPPNENYFFALRLHQRIIIQPGHTQTVYLDAAFIHAPSTCALIVGTRQMNQLGIIIRPVIWLPGTVATVTLVNTSGSAVYISGTTSVAKVVFTTRRFVYLLVHNHPIGQLLVPPTPDTGFTHMPEHHILQQLLACENE
ncbi:Cy101 [Cynomolgus cytomegalovirus]|uniref:Protein UL72 n=1 Tax=Cynomolgus macaque cytomegalovirus strain Mauritius TaxID=1690255 RepID=A0A0K1GZQ3_9BETA|nr:Cy101 [Cynomolgus cytomegalovirus]AKT72697.1 protein UL72 [Cynomolgus macaque cytomegalovirus strain Mauritius]AXG22067.1 protein UL72 [synthetic construct]APT39463.1 Cy101 [Cynomolgus cytomegalovirus]APT39636.1 Cy101 [Cynomolgus cytomegalovirus]APT39809.1 Cy101 [Cynomolgus cytomegalovirus]